MAYIEFSVEHQIIHRTDCFRVVKRSQNYLHAKFNFVGSEWTGLVKTAEFKNGKNGTPYSVLLNNDECLVPHEVLSGNDRYVYVSVFAGNLITVNVASVFLETSGYWENAVPAVDPTPSVYSQIMTRLEGVETTVVNSAQSASASATNAHNSEVNASASESNALQSEQNASASESNARQYASNAYESMQSASGSASSAGTSAQNASSSESNALSYAQRAESASSAIQNMNVTAHSVEGDPTASWSNGTLSLGLPKGEDGYTPQKGIDYTDGDKGDPGDPGYSPTASVSKSGNTATITITDKNGTTTASVTDGSKGNPGQDGVSPSVVVNNITGGHQVIITDKTGNHSFNVLDGEDGQPGGTGNSGVYVGETTPSDPDVNVWIDTDETGDDIVTDVQVNGTSVINNGVANIPLANNLAPGVVKLASADLGVGMDNNDYLCVVTANAALIKSGNTSYRPITPKRQHESVFYGLTKAAGVDMASSDNPVGTYTDEAKIAIQKMLGIYEPPFELIEDFTLAEEGRFDKTTEPDGTLYNFRGVFIRIFYAANLQTASTGYGRYMCEDSDGTYINTETGKYTAQTFPYTKFVYIMRNGAMAIAVYSRAASTSGAVSWQHKDDSGIKFDFKNIQRIYMNAADVEPAGTRIQIYAQRAY